MSKVIKCSLCSGEAEQRFIDFESGEFDLNGAEIVVPSVKINFCKNNDCEHSWIPASEEERVNQYVLKRSREFLEAEQVKLIREALGFTMKSSAANFLTLNSKAFTKWEHGYTEPNTANDLLMRLAVFSEQNYKFISDLHEKKFKFDPLDYELIAKKLDGVWNYGAVQIVAADYQKLKHALEALPKRHYANPYNQVVQPESVSTFGPCSLGNGKVA